MDRASGFSGVNFCPGIRFWKVKACEANLAGENSSFICFTLSF